MKLVMQKKKVKDEGRQECNGEISGEGNTTDKKLQEDEIKESAESPEASILSPSKVYGTRQSFGKDKTKLW